MLKIILIAYGLTSIINHAKILVRLRCFIGKKSRLLYEGINCYQCVGFWSGLVVSLLLGQGLVSILYGFATSGICELTDIVIKKIENMTDYEFQLQNEVSDLRATISQLRSENEELSENYQSLQKDYKYFLEGAEKDRVVIQRQRKEIRELHKQLREKK